MMLTVGQYRYLTKNWNQKVVILSNFVEIVVYWRLQNQVWNCWGMDNNFEIWWRKGLRDDPVEFRYRSNVALED